MVALTEEEKKELIDVLSKKGVKTHCPMCSHDEFVLNDGYTPNVVQTKKTGVMLGATVPSIAIICKNCGFMSNHALGVLGILSSTDNG